MSGVMGTQNNNPDDMFSKFEDMGKLVNEVNTQFKDAVNFVNYL